MTYATLEEFKAAIPSRDLMMLTDLDGTADAIDDSRILQALADASAEIDSYIGKAVALPLSAPPHILTVVCRDLALHRLYVNVGHDMEAQKSLRADAIAFLREVASGATALGDDGTGKAEITSPGVAMTDGPARLLTRDSLKGF